MPKAQAGSLVKVHYRAEIENEELLVDTSVSNAPLSFCVGDGTVNPAIDEAVLGMKPRQKKRVSVPPEGAFGQWQNEQVCRVLRTELPTDQHLAAGSVIQIRSEDGSRRYATIVDISESTVTLDANHPFAGKTVVFEIQLLSVN